MNLPNWITILRIVLIPFFIGLMLKYKETGLEYYRYYSILVFGTAVISDAVDGAIARIRHQKTQLGALLDPLADKLLLLSAVLLLSVPIQGLAYLPVWIPVTFISRDFLLIFGGIVIYIHSQKLTVKPNLLGKITTCSQMLTVIWILLQLPLPYLIWRSAGILTILSGLVYLWQGSKQLNNVK